MKETLLLYLITLPYYLITLPYYIITLPYYFTLKTKSIKVA